MQAQGIELQYDDLVDMQERDNISSASVTFDDQLVSADAKSFISQVIIDLPCIGQYHQLLLQGSAMCTSWPRFD